MELHGIINISISAKFRDFSFGRYQSLKAPETNGLKPNVFSNDESIYSFIKYNQELINNLEASNLNWDKFNTLSPAKQAPHIAGYSKSQAILSNIRTDFSKFYTWPKKYNTRWKKPTAKIPITKEFMNLMAENVNIDDPNEVLVMTVASICFYGFLRISECLNLTTNDL